MSRETEDEFVFYSETLGGWGWVNPIKDNSTKFAVGPFKTKRAALEDMNTTGIVLESVSRQAMNAMRES